jgi:UDPglucose--hexose-1-phosphate uridylyltransferase
VKNSKKTQSNQEGDAAMSPKIEFVKHIQKSTFHNPLMNNDLDTQELEIRKDPLTGIQSVFNPRLEDKVAMFICGCDTALIEKMARESESRCFLCGDRWQAMTPTYPTDVVPTGRIQVGQAVLFPNIFPAGQIHAVIRVGEKHYVPLDQFDPERVGEAFEASLMLAECLSADKSVRCLTINGNYLGPAGASIAHPHFQVMGGDLPFSYLESIFAFSEKYYQANRSCYWSDLVEVEKAKGERYIGATGPVEWVAAFSPQGTNEIVGVLPQRTHFLEMDDKDVKGLAAGMVKVLKGYADMGISTFNFAVYSGPLSRGDASVRCFMRIISRQNVYENYRTDDYFLQKLLRNELILTTPEALAKHMRGVFAG